MLRDERVLHCSPVLPPGNWETTRLWSERSREACLETRGAPSFVHPAVEKVKVDVGVCHVSPRLDC
eukprot:m.263663 g.263663  ORF g.263663 m.263663 type:complete len:66 (-) comp27121_c0_seq1:328-525(-)